MSEKAWDVVLLDHKDRFSLGVLVMPVGTEREEWAAKVISAGMPRQAKAVTIIKREFEARGMKIIAAEPGRKVKAGPETRWFWQVLTE